MANESPDSDLGIGVGAVLAVLAFLGALGMIAVDPSATTDGGVHLAAVPFALAVTAGVAAVAGIHMFWGE